MTITEEGIKVPVPFIELKTPTQNKRLNPVVKEAYLLLFEKFIRYKIIANYDTDENDEAIVKSYKCHNRITYMRDDLVAITFFKDQRFSTYAVGLRFKNMDGPEWDFDNSADAIALYDILDEYMTTC